MKNLRALHLYLGCLFAPMLLFFSVSGVWQMFGWERPGFGQPNNLLTYLSTIHTGHRMKIGHSLTSVYMKWFVLAMAASFIATLILGIVLAVKFQHRRSAWICLGLGVAIPVVLALLALAQ